jgi:UDP-N-acetylmuramoyl-tripeptide--D-alanyl-D-alanine ligase
MADLSLEDIYDALAIKSQVFLESTIFYQVNIDSRVKAQNSLFIAIRGKNNDGHNFLKQAFSNGCNYAIVEYIPEDFPQKDRLIIVQNSFEALNQIAQYNRKRIKGKVVAITGSVGKTTIKEIFGLCLNVAGKTFTSKKNFNNHFGVPLNLCNIDSDVDFAILELGMNHRHEIKRLSQLTLPDIAIISNISQSHIRNFRDESEIALEKSDIMFGLNQDGAIIVNADCKYYNFIKKRSIDEFGIKSIVSVANDVKIKSIENIILEESSVVIEYFGKEISFKISTISDVVIFNSLFVISAIKILNINNIQAILEKLTEVKIVSGRGNFIKADLGRKNIIIINDSYNASSTSVIAALKNLVKIKKITNKKIFVFLGDLAEVGNKSEEEHLKIINFLKDLKIDGIFLVGEKITKFKHIVHNQKLVQNFPNSNIDKNQIAQYFNDGDFVLIKASRKIQIENIFSIKN